MITSYLPSKLIRLDEHMKDRGDRLRPQGDVTFVLPNKDSGVYLVLSVWEGVVMDYDGNLCHVDKTLLLPDDGSRLPGPEPGSFLCLLLDTATLVILKPETMVRPVQCKVQVDTHRPFSSGSLFSQRQAEDRIFRMPPLDMP